MLFRSCFSILVHIGSKRYCSVGYNDDQILTFKYTDGKPFFCKFMNYYLRDIEK